MLHYRFLLAMLRVYRASESMIKFFIPILLFFAVLAGSVYQNGAQQFTGNPLHWVFVAALASLIGAYLYALARLFSRLREDHVATWANLGRPTIRLGETAAQNPGRAFDTVSATAKFLFSSQHRTLGDRHLSFLIWTVRALAGLAVVFFALMLASVPKG
jgi:hypothetical protein